MTRVEEELKQAAQLDDRLDEIRRARMWGELERKLDADVDGTGTGTGTGTVTASGWRRTVSGRRRTVILVAASGAAVAAAVIGAVVAANAWWPAGDGGMRVAAAKQVFEVPVAATARAQLGAAAVTLHGPARMQVERADQVVDVVLERGSMSGEYDGTRGGRMRVRTPHAVVEVVGTLFDVEVETTATCVAVAHGAVRVRADRADRMVSGGESWCTDAKEARAVAPVVEERMVKALLDPQPQPQPRPQLKTRAQTQTQAPTNVPTESPTEAPAMKDEPVVEDGATAVPADVAIYRDAERSLQLGDTALADELLARLVVNHAGSELVDDALFERARLAYARGAWGAARASLEQLLEMKSTPLREPARAMLCRIAERTGDRDARRCFDALHHEEKP